MREIILEPGDQGKAIIMTSHQLASVETLCDRIAMIHHGRVVLQGSVAQVRRQFARNMVRVSGSSQLGHSAWRRYIERPSPSEWQLTLEPNINPHLILQSLITNNHFNSRSFLRSPCPAWMKFLCRWYEKCDNMRREAWCVCVKTEHATRTTFPGSWVESNSSQLFSGSRFKGFRGKVFFLFLISSSRDSDLLNLCDYWGYLTCRSHFLLPTVGFSFMMGAPIVGGIILLIAARRYAQLDPRPIGLLDGANLLTGSPAPTTPVEVKQFDNLAEAAAALAAGEIQARTTTFSLIIGKPARSSPAIRSPLTRPLRKC
ncbi:MAG: hypothetical protein U0401_13385 [Anaerolineae bacterium]